jgi:hypothetical protein
MLKFLATIAVILWIIVGMAELVSLAPPPANELPVNNAKVFDQCAGDQRERSSAVRFAFCVVDNYIHNHREDINSVSTFLIMALTVVLILLNASLARSTRMAAIAAERAAVSAEKSLTDLERPWIFLEGATVSRRRWQPASVPNWWYISLQFKNLGRMPAIIERCLFEIKPKVELSDKPLYTGMQELSCQQTLGSGDSFKTRDVGPGVQREEFLVFYGKITYTELNGKVHETGFALEVSPNIAAYNALGNKAYDYFT